MEGPPDDVWQQAVQAASADLAAASNPDNDWEATPDMETAEGEGLKEDVFQEEAAIWSGGLNPFWSLDRPQSALKAWLPDVPPFVS